MPVNEQLGASLSLVELLKEVRTLRREVTVLKRIVGALNRRLLRLEKGKDDAGE